MRKSAQVLHYKTSSPQSQKDSCQGEGVLPYVGYISMCGPKGYGFSAVLVLNRVWFLHSSLELRMLFRRNYFFIIIDKTINKSPS